MSAASASRCPAPLAASVPSVRQCLERLAALHDTPQIHAQLIALGAEVWPETDTDESGCVEIDNAAERMRVLHELCQHLAANLRNFGTPAAPQSRAAKGAAPGDEPAKRGKRVAKASVASWSAARAEQQQHVRKHTMAAPGATPAADRADANAAPVAGANADPDPLLNSAQTAKRAGYSIHWLRKRRFRLAFPEPDEGGGYGHPVFWRASTVDAWVATHPRGTQATPAPAATPSRAPAPPALPPGILGVRVHLIGD